MPVQYNKVYIVTITSKKHYPPSKTIFLDVLGFFVNF